MYHLCFESSNLFQQPFVILRKGNEKEYLFDKLNSKLFDERFYDKKNFTCPKHVFGNDEKSFTNYFSKNKIKEMHKKENNQYITSFHNNSSNQMTHLHKRNYKQLEEQILETRLKKVAPKSHLHEDFLQSSKFDLKFFCEDFNKKNKKN